jgi:hypothetical protein
MDNIVTISTWILQHLEQHLLQVDGCPFAVANQQWRSVFRLPLDSEDWFSDQEKKKKTTTKKRWNNQENKITNPKKKEKLQDPLEMMIHGLHI